jgi:2-methylcitrate dehydratase PrpD
MKEIDQLVDFAVNTRFEDLPTDVVETRKKLITEIIGTLVAGAFSVGCDIVLDQVKEHGGKKESTIFVHGDMVPAHNAAFVNSIMARALDFESKLGPLHHYASTIPTAFAVSEKYDSKTGKDIITALAVGEEVASRIYLAMARKRIEGFDPTGVCGVFGTTVIAGRLMGLNQREMINALGIALNQAAGSFQSNIDGALITRVIQGLTSRSGIISAQLAKRGLTGVKNVFRGVFGYYNLFSYGEFDPKKITEDLGEKFYESNARYKKYPSCGCTIAPTEAALELARETEIKIEDIEEINVKTDPFSFHLAGHPFETRDNPEVDAQFSIPYTVANALMRKRSVLEDFTEPYIRDPRVLELASRVHAEIGEVTPGLIEMEVKMANGEIIYKKTYGKSIESKEDLMKKFYDCLNFAEKPMPEENVKKFLNVVDNFERLTSIKKLVKILVF